MPGGESEEEEGNRDDEPAEATPESTPEEAEGVEWEPPTDAPTRSIDPEPLVTNLEVPWDAAFAPTGELYVTERAGRLSRFDADAVLDGDAVDATELADEDRQRWPGQSAMGVAVHPAYPDPASVYVYYNVDGENRVDRFDARADDPRDTRETLVEGIEGDHTIGGRTAFGPGGDLWITVGTAEGDPARNPSTLGGSVLRVTTEGDPSPENPTTEDGDGADPRVFAYGHRNPQGLAWLPDGTALCTDHGPDGRDEVNRLRPGGNYGWPAVRGGPDDEEYESYADREEYHPPLVNTGPDETWAPAGCVFYEDDAIPSWRNRLLVATLHGRSLAVVTLAPPDADQPPLEGDARRYDADWLDGAFTATVHRVLADELGRLRHVARAPDGSVIAFTSNRDGAPGEDEPFPRDRDDAIVRLRPG